VTVLLFFIDKNDRYVIIISGLLRSKERKMFNFKHTLHISSALILSALSLSAFGSISDPCRSEPVESKRLFCQAINHLDANKCAQITNFDLRQHCVLQVKDGQRSVTWGLANKKPAS